MSVNVFCVCPISFLCCFFINAQNITDETCDVVLFSSIRIEIVVAYFFLYRCQLGLYPACFGQMIFALTDSIFAAILAAGFVRRNSVKKVRYKTNVLFHATFHFT